MESTEKYVFEPLASDHDRAAFSCGEISLDSYLKTQASQDIKRDLAFCYVLRKNSSTIIGYYTLSACSVELTDLPHSLAKTSGRYQLVPAVLIGRLAIDQRFQGQGRSSHLLLNALRRVLRTGIGVKIVIVDALHEDAAHFYEHHEFQRFEHMPLRLYVPVSKIRAIFPADSVATDDV